MLGWAGELDDLQTGLCNTDTVLHAGIKILQKNLIYTHKQRKILSDIIWGYHKYILS